MAKGKKIKLFKIASEINIGKDTIVDFLQGKGYDIQNKGTASLTPDMVELVFDKFKREKRAAEIQRDKLEKHKKVKKPTSDDIKSKEDIADDTQTGEQAVVEIKEEAKTIDDEVSKKGKKTKTKIEAEKSATKEKKISKKDEDISAPIKEKSDEKIVIDLDEISRKSKKTKSKSIKQEDKKIESTKEEDKKTSKPKEKTFEPESDTKNKSKTKRKSTKPSIKEKDNKELVQTEQVEKEEQQVDNKKDISTKDKDKQLEEVETDKEKSDIKSKVEKDFNKDKEKTKSRKRRKRKKLLEVEIDEQEQPHLRGLTIVGKIDIQKEKEQKAKKKQKEQVVPEEDDEQNESKRTKRKKRNKTKSDRRKKKKISIREMIKDEDVDKALKKTLAEMGDSSHKSSRSKIRQKKKAEREEKELKHQEEQEQVNQILELTEFVTTADLAELMDITPNDIIVKCMGLGLMVTLNQRLDKDTITLIADDYGYDVKFIDEKTVQMSQTLENDDDEENLEPRPPIVTVMGHVDHGKTSLLDFIRKTQVVAGEAGGITQHIGAYRVMIDKDKSITFLDTPGHEAFTAMRARGAQVTDIVVLIVAADDSVMPQTIEAISHAQAANVPIIVAINKVDKPDANPERIKQQLSEKNILVEDWGGKYQSVEISAKKGTNIDTLLEKILLEAELLDLKANPNRRAAGTIVEANMDKGLGALSTIIVQKGTLKIGDPFVAGLSYGRVRTMFDERGNKVKEATPTIPVRVTGFDVLPEAGDIFIAVKSDTEARNIATERQRLKREQEFRQVHKVTLDDISKQISMGGVKDLYLIIKGDVAGSVEALSDSLQKQSTEEVRVVVLHKGVGAISESDVMLAVASKAVIIGFQVSPTANARKIAEKENIDIRLYNIIYDAINEVRLALEGLLSPELVEEVTATVEIRKVFRISKLGYIAGCYVKEGKITRNDRVRVLRDGLTVYNGTLHSLKRDKDDVKEVDANYECGIMLGGFNDIEVGDIIEGYKINEIKRTL